MYIPREKLLRKFWVILLSLMVLVHTLILPVSAAVNVNENTSTVNRSTMKTAPIRAKEIEGPIPNPQYEYYLNHKEEFTYGYIPPKYIFPQEKTRNIRTRSSSEFSRFKKYDSRSGDIKLNHFGINVITPRKDQFYTGTCWAHAYLAVVESLLKIKYGEDYDLSEGHMAYNVDDQTNLQSGGLDEDALAYCARLSGPVLEKNLTAYSINEDDPKDRKQKDFDPSRAISLPEGERDTFKIMGDAFNKKLDFLVTRTLELDLTLENLKRCIYENGSVQGTYLIAEDGYSKDVLGGRWIDKWSVKKNGVRYHYVRNFKNSNYLKYNHAVALIGWDDDKEIKNKLGETAKGAFLVKNSVPAPPYDRYDDARGYHWISYESFLGNGDIVPSFTKIITPREVRPMDPDERASLKNVYNPCKLAGTTFNQKFDIKGKLNKAINVYERGTTEPETIKYVTYYNKSEGSAPYKIYITEDPELLKEEKTTFADGTKGDTLKDINSDKWVELASGTFTEKGYQTLEVIQPYTITSGKFALKIETDSKTMGLSYRSFPTVEKVPASSYMYNDKNTEHFFQKIDDFYKIFLGTVTVKPKEYTVTVNNDGNGTATANPSKGPKRTKVTIKADPNPGYEFDKWEVEGATAQDPKSLETTLTIGEGNVTAKAIFKKIPPKEYKVSFETTYGTKPADQKIKEGEKAKEPQGFEKDTTEILDSASGKTYIFKGWFLGTEEYNFETEVKGNKILKAKWEEKIIPIAEYTVSFETTYGTKPEDQKIKENEKAKAPTGFEKDTTEILDSASGKTYIFKGWFLGTEEYNFETEVKENKTLKAKWEEKIIPTVEYKVSFETTYGTKPEDQKIKENEKAKAPTGFEKDTTEILDSASGKTYIFKGWFLGTEEYNFETEVKENKTLKAKWEEKIIPTVEYTVSFETTYGTKPADQKIKEGEKAKEPQGFEKDTTEILDSASGKTYIFKGWFLGTEEYNFETEVKGNKILKAKWEEKIIPIAEYTVSFETTYGTKPEDQKIKENEKAKAPTGFEKDTTEILDSASGKTYIFKGWFLGTEEYNFETEVKENKTLKAKWEEKIIPTVEYKVSFETTYGTKPEDQKVKENGKAKAPTGFEKDTTEILDSANGKTYIFKGWFLGTEEYNFETEVKGNKILKAKWEEKIIPIAEYTVSFETTYGTKPEDQKVKENGKAKAPTDFEKTQQKSWIAQAARPIYSKVGS
ncbi:InlB B-repeat-containing protein [Fenollaria sporofastidiosus]|uniref:InlB B-repeat-containing protein n=1 Tax=Fenollaria sporofastidiosus TaxID=2811778 RepID=UPI001C0072AC|nr:C1 family peptidase [Fenollaria sporofastidiosus]